MRMRDLIRIVEGNDHAAQAMIDGFYDAMDQAPDLRTVSVSLHVDTRFPDAVELSLIRTQPGMRGRGTASKAMALLCDIADQYEVTLTLGVAEDADGREQGLTAEELRDWYTRWGFEGGMTMKRYPDEPRSAE